MTAIITLTSAGANTGPFDLYSDSDNYTVPFATGVAKSLLLIGYLTTSIPNGTINIKIVSTGVCNTIIDISVPGSPTTTTTTTRAIITTTTTTLFPITTTTSTTSACNLHIGDRYAGGIIVYLNSTGCHGMVVSEYDLITSGVNGMPYAINGTIFTPSPTIGLSLPSTFGSGLSNTNLLFSKFGRPSSTNYNDGSYAALYCKDYRGGGFNDWYLPSVGELDIIYKNMLLVGNFILNGDTRTSHYWSSSTAPVNHGYSYYFYDFYFAKAGNAYPQVPDGSGGNASRVRAVRNF